MDWNAAIIILTIIVCLIGISGAIYSNHLLKKKGNEMKNIKPCRFCDQKANVYQEADANNQKKYTYTVECPECQHSVEADNRYDAVELWNADN